ncbi:hypothetical protein JBE04_19465 [Streptomyces sp. PRKS01-29]|nr:hypothetical protein [Streptomyces sabulosicollis]MBI0296575.1 hypothetical protein [Streptomyces sabulosicollis]
MGALLWLVIPLTAGVTASVWAWGGGRGNPSPPDHNTWEDLDRYQCLRTVLTGSKHCKAA